MTNLAPFLSFYGAKWRIAPHYPPPRHDTIVEPFAGSAGYSVRYADRKVILNDADPVLFGVWSYLIKATRDEVLALPYAPDHVDDVKACQEAKWLIGFWINGGSSVPKKRPSKWQRKRVDGGEWATGGGQITWGKARDRLANQLEAIRHWKVTNKQYDELDIGEPATWYVDPPYSGPKGRQYRCKVADYVALGEWCRRLPGQAIVCECSGADWLPFQTLGSFKTLDNPLKGTCRVTEVLWLSDSPPPPSAGP